MVQHLVIPVYTLVGQQEYTLLFCPVQDRDGRSSRIAYIHFQTGTGTIFRGQLRNRVRGQCQVFPAVIGIIQSGRIRTVDDTLPVSVVHGRGNHHVVIARPAILVESNGHSGIFHILFGGKGEGIRFTAVHRSLFRTDIPIGGRNNLLTLL